MIKYVFITLLLILPISCATIDVCSDRTGDDRRDCMIAQYGLMFYGIDE